MTNNPEGTPAPAATPAPASSPASTVTDASGATFDRLAEPRSENRLVLEAGTWHQISRKYVQAQFISTGSFLLLVIAATLVLTLVMHQAWAWIPGGILTVILVWTLA